MYHSNEELIEKIETLVADSKHRATTEIIGQTVEDRPIYAVSVEGKSTDKFVKQALITANIHGAEVISSEVALEIIELLLADKRSDLVESLLEQANVTVVPAVNADVRHLAVDALRSESQGILKKVGRGNIRGVDLNRNFPVLGQTTRAYIPLAGTKISWLPWYFGPHPLSEPETHSLAELIKKDIPSVALHLHSPGHYFLYPYGRIEDAPKDKDAFVAMGEEFRRYYTGPDQYQIRQSRAWYAIVGGLDDWLYDAFGTLSVTVELTEAFAGAKGSLKRALTPFYWVNPPDPKKMAREIASSCVAALSKGCTYK